MTGVNGTNTTNISISEKFLKENAPEVRKFASSIKKSIIMEDLPLFEKSFTNFIKLLYDFAVNHHINAIPLSQQEQSQGHTAELDRLTSMKNDTVLNEFVDSNEKEISDFTSSLLPQIINGGSSEFEKLVSGLLELQSSFIINYKIKSN